MREKSGKSLGWAVLASGLLPLLVASAASVHADDLKTFRDCLDCPEMVGLPPGSVVMGLPYLDEGERQPTEVPGFVASRHEVTIDDWNRCVEAGSCAEIPQQGHWPKTGRHPVTNMTWNQANDYVQWLSSRTSKSYRLLSEVEWEYAARGGVQTNFAWGDEDVEPCPYGNFDEVSYKSRLTDKANARRYARCDDGFVFTAPVGSLRPNDFGLHDMGGNVWEWTDDCWKESLTADDGKVDCGKAAIRGDSFRVGAPAMSPSYRASRHRDFSNADIGFRVGRDH